MLNKFFGWILSILPKSGPTCKVCGAQIDIDHEHWIFDPRCLKNHCAKHRELCGMKGAS